MRQKTLCATCQYLGDAAFPSVRYYVGGELKSQLVGFSNRPNGAPVEYPSRRCDHTKMSKTLVYEALEHPLPCQYYKKKEWVRPETCGECQYRISCVNTDRISCSGHPFTGIHERSEKACINGKVDVESQMSFF